MARHIRDKNIRGRRNRHVRDQQSVDSSQREQLERQWYSKIDITPEAAPLVVHSDVDDEAYHRWLPYRQGFSPVLFDSFIDDGDLGDGPLCDPFCGSGTTVVEAALQGKSSVGVEAIPSLVFLANLKLGLYSTSGEVPEEVSFPQECDDWQALYASAPTPHAKGAVLLAAARTVKGDGRLRKSCPPVSELVKGTAILINEDVSVPLQAKGIVSQGDARQLPFAEGTIGGILTSPPYLPRYDYSRVNRPMEELFSPKRETAEGQMRAHARARKRKWQGKMHPAVKEVRERLYELDKKKESGVVCSYFDDLSLIVGECARVLQSGAPMTWVIAGAMVASVYVPSDLILADLCRSNGLEVEEILLARTFGANRKLGNLEGISPREVILSARKR